MSDEGAAAAVERWPAVGAATTERTGRWRGVSGAALLAGALALFTRTPGLLLVAGVAVAVVVYARLVPAPPATVAVERTVADPEADPGTETTVTVTVQNTGERLLPDVRVVDGVPDGVAVVDGSPQHGTALRAGAATAFTYTVRVPAGEVAFEPVALAVRDVAGVAERRTRVLASADETVGSQPPGAAGLAVPLRRQPSRLVGPQTNPELGDGIAFETVREYRRGDPADRVDWSRLASHDELRTVQFRAERTVTVVVVVDARAEAAVKPAPSAPTAVGRGVEVAATLLAGLAGEGHRLGLAGLAREPCWVDPDRGREHRLRLRDRLATDPAFQVDCDPAVGGDAGVSPTPWLGGRLPADAQVVLVSPLVDDVPVDCLLELEARGWPATVVSPDPTAGATAGATAGQRLVGLERQARIRRLRARGVPVVDLSRGVEPATALARAGWTG